MDLRRVIEELLAVMTHASGSLNWPVALDRFALVNVLWQQTMQELRAVSQRCVARPQSVNAASAAAIPIQLSTLALPEMQEAEAKLLEGQDDEGDVEKRAALMERAHHLTSVALGIAGAAGGRKPRANRGAGGGSAVGAAGGGAGGGAGGAGSSQTDASAAPLAPLDPHSRRRREYADAIAKAAADTGKADEWTSEGWRQEGGGLRQPELAPHPLVLAACFGIGLQ